ncbi:deoxynucleotidyltransferase terminal-interacting protein 2-like [Xenia sp. Carnegie-2017]|uniref:deoxynucleotidyltransferase terminal-interacting protein 2-like n=1 Tax=Xenia sp. Carnegie-2017 TaxID=2897299 RepID=UPI001F0499EB|nr:deoxynucleotidyltransferase terminal-interacting protein 2-like [Xenia sp. Carnegie-2017]
MDETNTTVIAGNIDQGLNEKQIMKKCVITSDFHKKEKAPQYHKTFNSLRKEKKRDKDRSAGKGWFNMPAPEMTQEAQRDLRILHMRNVLDPKHHYKKNNSKKLPKYFQFGTVVSGPAEFYSSRLPNSKRKKTIVESLLADAEFRRYNKRKYLEIQASREKTKKKGFYIRNKYKRKRS